MANFELKFISNGGQGLYIEKCPDSDVIMIYSNDEDNFYMEFDKSTSIKIAKTLRTEINKITEQEGGQYGNR